PPLSTLFPYTTLFRSHPRWNLTEDRVLLPDEDDQERIHELIYRVKRDSGVPDMIAFIDALMTKYGVESFIAGCSEIHIVAKTMRDRKSTRLNSSHVSI